MSMRAAFQKVLGGKAVLLPRILPLAEVEQAILTLFAADAALVLEGIPPAMPEWQQRYLLAAQVAAFLRRREGHPEVMLDYVLALTDALMELQEQCARAGVTLTREKLRQLVSADMAQHWEQALDFLSILAEHWPGIEQAFGMTIAATREVRLLSALAQAWGEMPTDVPVFAVGSTGSQEATAALLQAIAGLPNGYVILPGLDSAIEPAQWQAVTAGHPLYHIKQFLERMGVAPMDVRLIPSASGDVARSVWLEALCATAEIAQWRERALPLYDHIKLVPCAQAESEARVIALLLREALEVPGKRAALVTPDEGLMARVAAHMARYGVTVDRMAQGTLATTEYGSLWGLLLVALAEPERLIHLRSLLHHPLMKVDAYFLSALEPYWYGVATRRLGQLPKLPEALLTHDACHGVERFARELNRAARGQVVASEWLALCEGLLKPFLPRDISGKEVLQTALEAVAEADVLGPMVLREFAELVRERLSQPVRHGGITAHPQLAMLTPVEARLEQFDRVILASMTDPVWPGGASPNPWLNVAAQAALGLPEPEAQVSLMAHDMLMLGSSAELFLTWPLRDQGSPTTRSRFVERLVTLLAVHGVDEAAVTAPQYEAWAQALYAADAFAPSTPILPRPSRKERPQRLPVSALDTLFADPFSVYAKYVLGLTELDAIDEEAQASDFGSLAHKAIHALTVHWNTEKRPASEEELQIMGDRALRDFADRPSTALFWRTRLLRALEFVNAVEQERRSERVMVTPELPVEATLSLTPQDALTLHGRLDRLEEGNHLTIADYKTGQPPSVKEMLEGHATQLLAYAMLLEAQGKPAESVEYWRLPHGRHAGEITALPIAELVAQDLPQKLKAALAQMFDEATPFVASPDRYGHEYDGLSRYGEWAE